MAIEKRERYIVEMEVDGEDRKIIVRKSVVAASFQEVLHMFGEENVIRIDKLDYEEVTGG